MSTQTAEVVTTARFGRLERRGVLLGLGAAQLSVLTVALLVAVVSVYSAGAAGFATSALVWLPLAVAATATVRGRPVVAWLPLILQWRVRRLLGQTSHVTRPASPAPGILQIPGIPGAGDAGRVTCEVCPRSRRTRHCRISGTHATTGLPRTVAVAATASGNHTSALVANPAAPAEYTLTTATSSAMVRTESWAAPRPSRTPRRSSRPNRAVVTISAVWVVMAVPQRPGVRAGGQASSGSVVVPPCPRRPPCRSLASPARC